MATDLDPASSHRLVGGLLFRLRFSPYRYRFTTPEEREKTGAWWVRTYRRPATPFPWFARRPR